MLCAIPAVTVGQPRAGQIAAGGDIGLFVRYQWVQDRAHVDPDGFGLLVGLKRYF